MRIVQRWARWADAPHPFGKRLVLVLTAALVLASWIGVAIGRSSDFAVHREFGRRFVNGEFLYRRGLEASYPPFWAMAWSPLSFVPLPVARAVCYPAGVVALVLLLVMLHRLTRAALLLNRNAVFWTVVLALALSERFIDRDLAECGPNLVLLTLTWAGVWFWARRREWAGGTCLGLATALKCTPALFLAYFAWKREWKMAGVTAAATLLFTLAPVLRKGPAAYAQEMHAWSARLLPGVTRADSTHGIMGRGMLQNMALQPAIERFLIHTSPGHPLHLEHPLYIQFLNLSPAIAGLLGRAGLLALLVAVAWRFRRRVERRDSLGVLWECAGVSLLMLLLSPITWQQHCVGVIPAFFLLARTLAFSSLRSDNNEVVGNPEPPPSGPQVLPPTLSRGLVIALAAWLFWIIVLNRDVVGRPFTLLLDSYHVVAWNLVMLLAMVVACHRHLDAAIRERLRGAGTPVVTARELLDPRNSHRTRRVTG